MTAPAPPELDAEQEIDVRRYGTLLAARWWLLAAGLLAGIVAGYALALGSGTVWRAEALLTLGQPYTPSFGAPVQSYGTNPRAVNEIVRSESALKAAARASGMRVANLRGKVSVQQVGNTGAGAARQVPLIQLTVQGPRAARVEAAANRLAELVVARTTRPYVGEKVRTLTAQLESLQQRINTQTQTVTALQEAAADTSLGTLDRLALIAQLNGAEQLLGTLKDERNLAQQQLAFSQNVESATIVQPAAAEKTSARSARTSMLVGGLLGLLLGALAAVLWEPVAARIASRSA